MASHDPYDGHWERLYEAHGMKAPWKRVWRDGVDITETVPPEKWPWPYNPRGRRPAKPRRSRGSYVF